MTRRLLVGVVFLLAISACKTGTPTGPGGTTTTTTTATPTTTTTTTTPPLSATGRWVGTNPDGMIVEVNLGNPPYCPSEFDLDLNLTATANVVTGTATTRLRKTTPGQDCADVFGRVSTYGLVNGRVESDTISFDLGTTGAYRFSGRFTATRMTGTFVITEFPESGRFAVDRQ